MNGRTKAWTLTTAFTALLCLTASTISARVETSTRFLEYDQKAGIVAYELTLRNLGSLPVTFVSLSAYPGSMEGPLTTSDLVKEQQVSRRFTFAMPKNAFTFQPKFSLEYTDFAGEVHRIETSQSPLNVNVDFAAVDVASGEVALKLILGNLGQESLLFLELWSENPSLPEDRIALGDLAAGEQLQDEIRFRLPPGEQLFNPTLHLSYHAFEADGTRYHRKFYTILQPRLDRVAEALAKRN